MRRSTPRRNASAAAEILLAGKQQSDVDRHAGEDRLLDRGQPFFGAGNLDEQIRLRRRRACSSLAAASVPGVSCASSGETSSETQPSTPLVRSWTGRNRSAARLRSSSANSKNNFSPDLPSASLVLISSSKSLPFLIA